MQEFAKVISTISLSMIITSYLIIELRNLKYSAYVYMIQAILMCTLFAIFAIENPGLYYWAMTAFVTKVVIIPWLLLRYIKKTTDREFQPLIGYLGSIFLISAVVILLYVIYGIYQKFGSTDTLQLRGLRW